MDQGHDGARKHGNQARKVRDMSNETYEGWTNRETWAVALHINNDQGWQEDVHEALRAKLAEVDPDDLTDSGRKYMAGDVIRENVEQALTFLVGSSDGEDFASAVRNEIGSLWRVNWTELGASFLDDLSEG